MVIFYVKIKGLAHGLSYLQPYKDKCMELEKENKSLSEKYERDLSELQSKMNEVEGRYKDDKGIEGQYLVTLKSELELYKNKLQALVKMSFSSSRLRAKHFFDLHHPSAVSNCNVVLLNNQSLPHRLHPIHVYSGCLKFNSTIWSV